MAAGPHGILSQIVAIQFCGGNAGPSTGPCDGAGVGGAGDLGIGCNPGLVGINWIGVAASVFDRSAGMASGGSTDSRPALPGREVG